MNTVSLKNSQQIYMISEIPTMMDTNSVEPQMIPTGCMHGAEFNSIETVDDTKNQSSFNCYRTVWNFIQRYSYRHDL